MNTDDLRIAEIHSLISPSLLMKELPISEEVGELVGKTRQIVEAVLNGKEDRLLVIVGPCSIHDASAAIEYGKKLKAEIDRHQQDLLILMRVYFDKPRTTVGWKGFINDPHLDESYDINRGLHSARSLLIQLAEMGVPAGTEFLDVITPQYIADVVTWGAIGARTTESQVHRQLASGLSMPVGFKNGTDGNIQIALDAIAASRHSHVFLSVTKEGVSAIVRTRGNEACHVILRGGKGPNYEEEHVQQTLDQIEKAGFYRSVMIDFSHGNSRKDPKNQPLVAENVALQLEQGQEGITGVMIESHLKEGAQKVVPGQDLVYGQSITDACLGWEDTVTVLDRLAQAVRKRRELRVAKTSLETASLTQDS